MTSEPSPQMFLWNTAPKRPAPSARAVEERTEPGSKCKDPLPSYLAGESLKASGIWHRQLWTVYHGVRRFPGLTAAELTQRLGLEDRYICNRRLPELRDRFHVVCNGRHRRCTVSRSRRLSQTWYCSRRFFDKGPGPEGISAPKPAGQRRARATEAREHGPVLTVAERQQLRRRLAGSGGPAGKFLNDLDKGES